MVCSIVQLHSKFLQSGCPNCEKMLELQGSTENIEDCTSQVYEGLITLTDPKASWVARWNRLDGYVPATYAVKVVGQLPDEMVDKVEGGGVRYIP